jgi:hypothetical protein
MNRLVSAFRSIARPLLGMNAAPLPVAPTAPTAVTLPSIPVKGRVESNSSTDMNTVHTDVANGQIEQKKVGTDMNIDNTPPTPRIEQVISPVSHRDDSSAKVEKKEETIHTTDRDGDGGGGGGGDESKDKSITTIGSKRKATNELTTIEEGNDDEEEDIPDDEKASAASAPASSSSASASATKTATAAGPARKRRRKSTRIVKSLPKRSKKKPTAESEDDDDIDMTDPDVAIVDHVRMQTADGWVYVHWKMDTELKNSWIHPKWGMDTSILDDYKSVSKWKMQYCSDDSHWIDMPAHVQDAYEKVFVEWSKERYDPRIKGRYTVVYRIDKGTHHFDYVCILSHEDGA